MHTSEKNRKTDELSLQDIDCDDKKKVEKNNPACDQLPEQDDKLIGDDLAIQQAKHGEVKNENGAGELENNY